MPELLLEVGCEELPASFVRSAYTDLATNLKELLVEHNLLSPESKIQCLGTPRRLIVSVDAVIPQQPDSEKEQRGPALSAAFDPSGSPTPALIGFCKGAGVDVSEITKDDKYVWVKKQIKGQAATQLLTEILPKAIRNLSFEKSMRWGSGKMRFARPIRWILSRFDGQVVQFQLESISSGGTSRGHRFYADVAFEATNFDNLLTGLRKHLVEPDPELRKQRILSQAVVSGGTALVDPNLLDENVFLTEWPAVVHGKFPEHYLSLPRPVLIMAMAKHEKMFPVVDGEDKISNDFLFVRNGGENDTVKKGNEWVLGARFNDARFFYNSDTKHNLDHFLEKTETIMFGRDLGTVFQRSKRLEAACVKIAEATQASKTEVMHAGMSGKYAKADLSTGLVGELPALQGVIGAEYGARENFPADVLFALSTQYDPSKVASGGSGEERTALRLILADQIDKMAGYFALGHEPKGSSDPYGLRRSATYIIDTCWKWELLNFDLKGLFDSALNHYIDQGILKVGASLPWASIEALFTGRYQALLSDIGDDVREAATATSQLLNPRKVKFQSQVCEEIKADADLVQATTRVLNLVASAESKGETLDPTKAGSNLNAPEGEALLKIVEAAEPAAMASYQAEDVKGLASALKPLTPAINAFFEAQMIMVEDLSVRASRLGLLKKIAEVVLMAGDLSKIR